MKRAGLLLSTMVVYCASCISGVAQDPGDQSQRAETPSQLKRGRHVPVFGSADEFALATGLGYYEPEPGFNRRNRDTDLQVANINIGAHMQRGWEFQFDGLLLRAQGFRTAPSGFPISEIPSNAVGFGFGPLARWNVLQFNRFRSFVEAGGNFILFNRPWPALGTINDFFLRAGGGIGVRVSSSYWIESVFHFAHISNGECICTSNPAWNGRGLSLSLRHTFHRQPEESKLHSRWPFYYSDENAWITGVEVYTPAPGLDRRHGAVQADMRELRISRAWHFPGHLEFQLGGMAQSTTTAGFGPVLRWDFVERKQWRLFTDAGVDLLQTGSPAYIIPWRDTGYNFFPRGRAGASLRLHQSYWLEASFGWAHVTSGFGGSSQLLPWSGQGISLSLRHTFQRSGRRPLQ